MSIIRSKFFNKRELESTNQKHFRLHLRSYSEWLVQTKLEEVFRTKVIQEIQDQILRSKLKSRVLKIVDHVRKSKVHNIEIMKI